MRFANLTLIDESVVLDRKVERFHTNEDGDSMNVKMTFTIPEDIAREFKDVVAKSKRSAFVTNVLREKLRKVEAKRVRQQLIEDYKETREEDRLINEEWKAATLEGWPE